MNPQDTTHFGFNTVPCVEKTRHVHSVFSSVAPVYDLMNDVMSLGVHRLWKRQAVSLLAVRSGQRVLDVACGSGDLSFLLAKQIGRTGQLVACDINEKMLVSGQNRLIDAGYFKRIKFVLADVEALAFCDNCFDRIMIAFGLRNVTHQMQALGQMYHVLKYGGCLVILEFSQLVLPILQGLYDSYSFKWIPFLGRKIANDEQSYRYLVESIRQHPDQHKLTKMLQDAGFGKVEHFNLSAGIVAIHRAYKI